MSDILTVEDIQKLTGKKYPTALTYLKIATQYKRVNTGYAITKDKFVKWAKQNNIELVNQTEPLEQ